MTNLMSRVWLGLPQLSDVHHILKFSQARPGHLQTISCDLRVCTFRVEHVATGVKKNLLPMSVALTIFSPKKTTIIHVIMKWSPFEVQICLASVLTRREGGRKIGKLMKSLPLGIPGYRVIPAILSCLFFLPARSAWPGHLPDDSPLHLSLKKKILLCILVIDVPLQ